MTQKEIHEFLANTKVYVNGKSKDIQEKLFSLGYKWYGGDPDVSDTEYPFLFIYKNKFLSMTNNMEYFSNHRNREISAEEILSLDITVSTYRPFKDKEECWAEMKKHQPFGWLKLDDMYINIVCVHSVDKKIELSPENLKFKDDTPFDIERMFMSFERTFNEYLFADGTPFGIKED